MADSNEIATTITGGVVQGVAGGGAVVIEKQTFINNYYDRRAPVEEPTATSGEPISPCPYPGLAYFGPHDADLFFGRDAVIARLEEAVGRQSMTALLGASGSGKSSVVLAGLLPRLLQSGYWCISYFRIGLEVTRNPFLAVARALVPLLGKEGASTQLSPEQLEHVQKLGHSLEIGAVSLPTVLGGCRRQNLGKRVLLIADQFEEAFTLVDEAVRHRFINALLEGFPDPALGSIPDICLILTLRADFFPQALGHRPFAEALQDHVVNLPPMNREELRAAIVRPAEKAKVLFEPDLVETLLDEVESKPGSLPLLQFALREMWGRQEKRRITPKSYHDIGRIEGALSRRADEIFARMTRNGADTQMEKEFQRLFTRLVTPGEGQEDTRRVVKRQELGEKEWSLAQRLAGENNRLVVVTNVPAVSQEAAGVWSLAQIPGSEDNRHVETSAPAVLGETAEVVHEALIRHWPRLGKWIDRDRDFLSWQRHIKPNVEAWSADHADEGALLRGNMLAPAIDWLDRRRDDLSSAELGVIEASIAASKAERRNSALIKLFVFLVIAGVGLSGYLHWRDAQPWACLTDLNKSLANDQDPRLRGGAVSIGRSGGGPIENKVLVKDQLVSRLHLFISRNLRAVDSRSQNGTTVNASFLPYSFERELHDGDLIALAGVALFRFSVLELPILTFFSPDLPKPSPPPAGAWGILIDGRQRTATVLTEDTYFVSEGNNGDLILNNTENAETERIKIRVLRKGDVAPYGIALLRSDNNRHLFVQAKEDDYNYNINQIDNHSDNREAADPRLSRPNEVQITSNMTVCYGRWKEPLSTNGALPLWYMVQYSKEERPTDAGVECDLGPFQIVLINATEPNGRAR
jgi:pSer/pThr/pTyr-binding forkhead associated (FHA) protein